MEVKKVKPLRIIGKDFRNRPITPTDLDTILVDSNICTVVGYINRNKHLPNAKPEDEVAPYCPPRKSMPQGEQDNDAEWKHGEMSDFQIHVREYEIYGKYNQGGKNGASES